MKFTVTVKVTRGKQSVQSKHATQPHSNWPPKTLQTDAVPVRYKAQVKLIKVQVQVMLIILQVDQFKLTMRRKTKEFIKHKLTPLISAIPHRCIMNSIMLTNEKAELKICTSTGSISLLCELSLQYRISSLLPFGILDLQDRNRTKGNR